jgi:hypothetical protein
MTRQYLDQGNPAVLRPREASAAQRLRCVLGMLSSLEVKVLWPT